MKSGRERKANRNSGPDCLLPSLNYLRNDMMKSFFPLSEVLKIFGILSKHKKRKMARGWVQPRKTSGQQGLT